ncbi:hypothetical protein CFOL_v3_17081, partial [Cephalotus follicularis]
QRNWKLDPNGTNLWYDGCVKVFQADKYRKGACINSVAMTHDVNSFSERPRKVRAKQTNEDVHISVWASWWKEHQWGYKCCKQTIQNSYCTNAAGTEAIEAGTTFMKANIARTEGLNEKPSKKEKRVAIWGTERNTEQKGQKIK